jgi:hypothetical protein
MSTPAPRPFLDELLCTTLAVGLVLVAILPGARGVGAAGWMPLWLVGMPAVALWALRGFPMPPRAGRVRDDRRFPRTQRSVPQARRAPRIVRRAGVRAAA